MQAIRHYMPRLPQRFLYNSAAPPSRPPPATRRRLPALPLQDEARLRAAHGVAAILAFVARATANGDAAAHVARRGIGLHGRALLTQWIDTAEVQPRGGQGLRGR